MGRPSDQIPVEPDPAKREQLIEDKPSDYIEKTLPEDPSDRAGQKTATTSTRQFRATRRSHDGHCGRDRGRGGLPVIDVTATKPGLGVPVTEATNGFGIAVTKVTLPQGGLPVTFVSPPLMRTGEDERGRTNRGGAR